MASAVSLKTSPIVCCGNQCWIFFSNFSTNIRFQIEIDTKKEEMNLVDQLDVAKDSRNLWLTTLQLGIRLKRTQVQLHQWGENNKHSRNATQSTSTARLRLETYVFSVLCISFAMNPLVSDRISDRVSVLCIGNYSVDSTSSWPPLFERFAARSRPFCSDLRNIRRFSWAWHKIFELRLERINHSKINRRTGSNGSMSGGLDSCFFRRLFDIGRGTHISFRSPCFGFWSPGWQRSLGNGRWSLLRDDKGGMIRYLFGWVTKSEVTETFGRGGRFGGLNGFEVSMSSK